MSNIERTKLLNNSKRLVWLYGQTGFGKTVLLSQHYKKNINSKLWLDTTCTNKKKQYLAFIKNNDKTGSAVYIDNIHLFNNKWLEYFFAHLPTHANVFIASQNFRPDITINITLLNKFQVFNHQQLRLNYTDIVLLLPKHNNIQAKDVYALTLGWPVLVTLICNKIPIARDIEHLQHLVNSPPNALSHYFQQQLLNNTKRQQRQFLIWLSLVDVLPKALFNHTEQMVLSDFCEHELNGLALHHESYWQLLPLLRQAGFINLSCNHSEEIYHLHCALAERFSKINDIKSAIILMLQIGKKPLAIKYLSKMGGLLEWMRHGLTNLLILYDLFNQQDAEQYEAVAWLSCIVNYKLGNVSISRKIVNAYKQKQQKDLLVWTVADTMVMLHEGRILDASNLIKLNNFSQSNSQTAPFTRALINNLLSVIWLQTGANNQASIAIAQAIKFFNQLDDAEYGKSFINIHQSHHFILKLQFVSARELLNKVNSQIQLSFNKDKSIRISQQVVKLELNFLTGLMPAIHSIDQLIKKLNNSESWFDLYATLYPIAMKIAIQQNSLTYITKWFSIAYTYQQNNPMEYVNILLSQLAKLVIQQQPTLKKTLNNYIIEDNKHPFYNLPWRLQSIELELMWRQHSVNIELVENIMQIANKLGNKLLYLQAKTIINLTKNDAKLSKIMINELENQNLIGLIWQMKKHLSPTTLVTILKNHNRLSLYSKIKSNDKELFTKLSEKEQLIHNLICKKLRNKQIALELDISEQTVKFHLKNIFRKLKIKSRKEAAAIKI